MWSNHDSSGCAVNPMKRFYKTAGFIPCPTKTSFEIQLDGKPVRTPARKNLTAPNQRLAKEICSEWNGQGETVFPDQMPMTQISMTIIDHVIPYRETLEAECLDYLDTDLLFYRSPENIYAQAQTSLWDPVVRWAESFLNTSLVTTTELVSLQQNQAAHRALNTYVHKLSSYPYAALDLLTRDTGSILLAAAFLNGAVSADDVFAASFLEEKIKSKIYREDIHGIAPDQERREARLKNDLALVQQMLDLLD